MGYNFLFWKLHNQILSDAELSWHQGYTSHMMYDAFLIEKNAKYSKKCSAFLFFDTKTYPLHCCRHKKSCEWYILEAKAVLHQMRHNFLSWKLCNHILSHAALSWHQECTSHTISVLSYRNESQRSHRPKQ